MPPDSESAVEHARSATAEERKSLLHEPSEEVLRALLENPHLEGPHVVMLERLDLPAPVLAAIAEEGTWTSSEGAGCAERGQHPKWSSQYNVRIALVRSPHTPAAAAQSFLLQLTLGDLNQIARLEGLAPHLKKQLRDELLRRSNGSEMAARSNAARDGG